MKDFALLVLGTTIIGNSSVLFRIGGVDPAAAAFWRMMFALPVFLVWALIERRKSDATVSATGVSAAIFWPAALAGFSFAVDLTLSNIALELTTMTNFIILVHLAPVLVVLVAWMLFGEKPTLRLLLALALAIIGAVLLVQSGRSGAAPRNALLGDLASVAAAVGYAGFILATRRARMFGGTGIVSLISAATCAAFCLIASIALGEQLWPQTAKAWVMMALLGLGCHALGQGLSAYAVGSLGASLTSIVLVYGVAVTVAGGWLVFGEVPVTVQFIGGALVLAAVIICRPSAAAKPVTPPQA